MAAAAGDVFDEGKQQFGSIADANGNATVKYPSFKASKPSFSDGGKHSAIGVFPLLVKEAALPLKEDFGVDSSLGQDVCTISVLPDEGNTIPQCTSQFTLLRFVKALLPSKNQMFIDAQLKCQKTQNRINVLLGSTDSYQSCVVDINVEKGNDETVTSHSEVVGNAKSESVHLQNILQRQASLSTDKSVSERSHDAPTNRWRRYKRAASFDSRKIVILFSILSSVGTLILIYLTLRVKQSSDNSFNHINSNDEPPHKQKKTEEACQSSLSSLSDTVALSCLARVSRLDQSSLSLVSKRYHSLMTSPELYYTRSQLGCTEKCLYVCLRTPPDLTPRWFILRRAKTLNQLILIRTFPSQTPESASVVAVDWGIYIFGGIIDDEYTSDVLFLNCRTHTWLRAPSMGARRAFAAAGVLNGKKIYVFGGCENPNSSNWGEVFDLKLQTWDTLPLPDWKICSNSIHQSLVIDKKVYGIDKYNRNFYYSLNEGKWDCKMFNLGLIRIPDDSELESRRQWCVVDKLLYCCDHLWNLYWCEPNELDSHEATEMNWKQVKGLEALQWSFSGSRLVHFDEDNGISRLNRFGKNIVLFWEVSLGIIESLEIWCAEISLKRDQEDEIWGKIEWSDVVMTLDPRLHSFELIHSLSVNV